MNGSPIGDLSIQWSIRASCALVYGRLLYRVGSKSCIRKSPGQLECWLWTAAFVLFVLHVGFAFHHIHQWQHYDAWQRTAIETESVVGIRRGDGIWANYLMLVIWGFDVLRIHHARRSRLTTSQRSDHVVALFIGFMFVNATFVFWPDFYRHLLLPALAIPLFMWCYRTKTQESFG